MAGRCTFANRAAAELLGYARGELLGRHMRDPVHHHRPDGSPYAVGDCPMYRSHRTRAAATHDGPDRPARDMSRLHCAKNLT